jgi:hypothetical protein
MLVDLVRFTRHASALCQVLAEIFEGLHIFIIGWHKLYVVSGDERSRDGIIVSLVTCIIGQTRRYTLNLCE